MGEPHETRRKPMEIVNKSKAFLVKVFSWRNIFIVSSVIAGLALLFILVGLIAPSSPTSSDVSTGTSGNGLNWPSLNKKALLTTMLIAIGVALIPWKWKTIRHISGAVAVVCFALLIGPWTSSWFGCDSSDTACNYQQAVKEEQQRQKQVQAARAIEQSKQPVAPGCNVYRKAYRFEATKPNHKFNPGGVCFAQLFTEGHCVYVTQNNSEATLGPICNHGGGVPRDKAGNKIDMPIDIDRAWSADGRAFDAGVGLWAPRPEQLFSWRS